MASFSGDNRYILYLDGKPVARGPVRGDLENYFYDSLTLTLTPGNHVLAVEIVVWGQNNAYDPAPWSEIHDGGGWIFEGAVYCSDDSVLALSTPLGWMTCIDTSRRNATWREAAGLKSRIPAPPMECVDFNSAFKGWKTDLRGGDWEGVSILGKPWMRDTVDNDTDTRWLLTPREIAPIPETPYAGARLLRQSYTVTDAVNAEGKHDILFLESGAILFHLKDYFTGFCNLKISAGKGGGTLLVRWTEALGFDGKKSQRGDPRGEVSVNVFTDRLEFKKGEWEWSPFTYRSGRFLELECTAELPVEVEISFTRWNYPFRRIAEVQAQGLPDIATISRLCWNTVLACAHEHYEDCPFWEQMQYAGDTRIQALISYRVTGDATLARQAIRQFAHSLSSTGLTASRYPTNWRQYIPEFSLIWIMMAFDYLDYTGDAALLREILLPIRCVLSYFEERKRRDGLIENPGFWNVTDWAGDWTPYGDITRGSGKPAAIIALFYAAACRRVAEFTQEEHYAQEAQNAIRAVNRKCFDSKEEIYTDVPGEKWYSQHTNAIALLADAVPAKAVPEVLHHLFHDDRLVKTTTYFGAYLFEVIRKFHVEGELENVLESWRWVLQNGFETVPECPSLSCRSDCHAWGASPVGAFVTLLLGVYPAAPGFQKIAVRPLPGKATAISGIAPIGKKRTLEVKYEKLATGAWEAILTAHGGDAELLFQHPGSELIHECHLTAEIPQKFSSLPS